MALNLRRARRPPADRPAADDAEPGNLGRGVLSTPLIWLINFCYQTQIYGPSYGAGRTFVTKIDFTWIETGTRKPVVKEPLLLMLGNAQAGKTDVEVGFWDGDEFRFTRGQQDQAHLVTRWARLEPCLPKSRKGKRPKPRIAEERWRAALRGSMKNGPQPERPKQARSLRP
jgi:hypothetical protein